MDIQEKFVKMNRNNIEAYTPKYAVDIILPYIKKDKIIWCPFSKDYHNFADYLREKGYTIINTHYNPETGKGKNFLTYKPDFYFDIILDNPPFKGKSKFVKKVMSYNKPFALFLPFNSFGDNGIPKLFIDNNLEPQMLIPDKRTEFENQEKRGISFKTVYICNRILPKQIVFTKLNKYKQIGMENYKQQIDEEVSRAFNAGIDFGGTGRDGSDNSITGLINVKKTIRYLANKQNIKL